MLRIKGAVSGSEIFSRKERKVKKAQRSENSYPFNHIKVFHKIFLQLVIVRSLTECAVIGNPPTEQGSNLEETIKHLKQIRLLRPPSSASQ